MEVRDTSREAWESLQAQLPQMDGKILRHVDGAGRYGLTCERTELDLDMRHQTVSGALTRLSKSGLVLDSGRRRRTNSGRQAIVWVSWRHAAGQGELDLDAEPLPMPEPVHAEAVAAVWLFADAYADQPGSPVSFHAELPPGAQARCAELVDAIKRSPRMQEVTAREEELETAQARGEGRTP